MNAGLDAYKKISPLSHPNCTTNCDIGNDPKNMTYQQAYETKTTLPGERTVPKLDFANEINGKMKILTSQKHGQPSGEPSYAEHPDNAERSICGA